MNRIYFLLVVACSCFLLNQPAQAQTGQTITGTITVGGIVRDYRLYVPISYVAGQPTPLLLNLHGYGSNNQQQEFYGDFRAIADTARFLIVHPNGTIDNTGNRYWNCFVPPGSGGPDDTAFLSALVDAIGLQYTLDPNRLYCTGFSNGGFMSYELACHLGARITAIASVAGSIATTRIGTCAPTHPTPIMEIHGDADGTVPYQGNTLFTPVPAVLNYWVTANLCTPTPTVTAVPDTDPTDGCTATHSVWRGNQVGAVVEHFRIVGGGHTWPGAPVTIGVTNRDINASQEVWRFLRRYRLSQLATAAPLPVTLVSFTGQPNPGCTATLSWRTASEQNSRAYEVQASADGLAFGPLGTVPSHNQLTGDRYQFAVASLTHSHYFRLKLLDLDGTFTFSPVVVLAGLCGLASVQVYPNPASSQLTVSGLATGSQALLYNSTGQLVRQTEADENGAVLPVSGLPAGVYLIRAVGTTGQAQTVRVVKQ